jgi:tRNA modification GTPase
VLAALDQDDTIAAIASPQGPSLRGIVRLSGPDAWSIALEYFQPECETLLPRRAGVRTGQLRISGLRPPLPAMVALWPGPRSYTGQDVAEIHTAGSAPILSLVLSACLGRGARHAQPGEFTLRAFLCGRIDLTRAEAVLGVIDARNHAQLDAALEQLAGGLSRPILALRDRLLDLVSHLEANLDFVDEPDVDPLGRDSLSAELATAACELATLAARLSGRDRGAGHPRVVLIGPPNSGKSRLFNALTMRDHAIVSPHAGTTRDYLTGLCECGETIVELVDTAGISFPRNRIETQAQSLRAEQAGQADLLLLCRSLDAPAGPAEALPASAAVLHVRTKCDLDHRRALEADHAIRTSAVTGDGLDRLRAGIAGALQSRDTEADLPASTAARCQDSLIRAGGALESAAETVRSGGGEELVAIELRLAIDELGKVVGAVFTDDILDRIFQRFCIGK